MPRPFAQGTISYVAPTFTVDALNFLFLGETDYNAATPGTPLAVPIPSPNPMPNDHIAWFNRTYVDIGKPKNIEELFTALNAKNHIVVTNFLNQGSWRFTPDVFIDGFTREIISKPVGAAYSHAVTCPYAAHWRQLKFEFAANSII